MCLSRQGITRGSRRLPSGVASQKTFPLAIMYLTYCAAHDRMALHWS
jgi:hypothetical protein